MRSLLALAVLCTTGCAHHLVTLPKDRPAQTLIRDVAVLDVEAGTRAEHQDVLLEGNTIARIAPTGLTAGAQALVVDGRGATLLPGLIDMHVHSGEGHAPPWDLELPDRRRNYECLLYAGVTTIFDPGALDTDAFSERDAIARGEVLGPRMYSAGPIFTAPDGHPAAMMRALAPAVLRSWVVKHQTREIATPEAAEPAVAALAELRPDFIKLVVDQIPDGIPKLDEARARAIAEAAKRHGLRAVAHIGTTDDAALTGRAGVAAWVHGVYRERIPDARIAELAAFKIPMISTVAVFDAASRFGEPRTSTALEREMYDPRDLVAFSHVPQPVPENLVPLRDWTLALRPHRKDWTDNLRRLHEAGVEILAGTDSAGVFPGAGLHRELHFLADAGFTPAQVIRAATLDPARFLTQSPQPPFGRVAEGTRADLLLVDGNPLEDLRAVSQIRAVFRDGVRLDRHPRLAQ